MEIALLGHMGRDEALADRLIGNGHRLHILAEWENPGLVDKAQSTGGSFHIVRSIKDAENVADVIQAIEPGMFITNFDTALAAGAVDAIQKRVIDRRMKDLLIPCPNQAASRIEWDKFYLRELVERINPKYNPEHFRITNPDDICDAVQHFKELGKEIAIKPRNLTGGKGVKVQGKHFDTYEEAEQYARTVLNDHEQTGVEIQEKIEGHEFTLQIFTDGKVCIKPPPTYDYPYREDGDIGPGTGGMGTFTMPNGNILPFMEQKDYEEAMKLTSQLLEMMKADGLDYKGVIYPTFFKSKDGIKIVEVNARGGDPELVNILDLFGETVNTTKIFERIAHGVLSPNDITYRNFASVMIYLVSPHYAYADDGPPINFSVKTDVITDMGCKVRFAAARKTGNESYVSTKHARIVGISAINSTPWEARERIMAAIAFGFTQPLGLDFRDDVGNKEYIDKLVA